MTITLGAHIRQLRESKEIDQESVGSALGCSHSAVSQYESGKRELPTEKIKAVARHLQVDPLDLLEIRLQELITSTIDQYKRSR
ncbi:helix-turn-helix domain-containing protein [Bdellovibrio bacteriovorus]|uniref:helix-turn-helix domain-containing protein n=1 Tax=Bdellovibrio bacteriovorus TaxID=959 RepID=UPI0035A704D4